MTDLCAPDIAADAKKAALDLVQPQDVTGAMLATCAGFLLDRAAPLPLPQDAVDICGTGGDMQAGGVKSFNISTAAAFILAAGGVPVIKHGNKAVSSQSGSSDVLAALHVEVCETAEDAERQFRKHNLCFIAAPAFHPLLKDLAVVRKSLGRPSFLNLLGPLCNPARVARQVIGVYDPAFLRPMAEAAQHLGKTDVITVHGADGMDEFSLFAASTFCRLKNGTITDYTFYPEIRASAQDIAGGDAQHNAAIIRNVFEQKTGSCADIVCLNAGAGFMVAERADDMQDGFKQARDVLQSGAALRLLNEMAGSQ